MKKLLCTIAFLVSLLLLGQNNKPSATITINGGCNPVFANCHHDKDTCTLSVLLKHPYLAVPCGRVTNFCISLPVNGVFVDKLINGNYLTDDVMGLFKSDKYDCYILFKLIHYQGDDGSIKTARGMTIHLLKK